MTDALTPARIRAAYERVRGDLLAERNAGGYWTGELSTSALSTATAVMALEMVRRGALLTPHSSLLTPLITGGLAWIAAHQNDGGGWGDTTKSFSNISTTMLCHAVFHATGTVEEYPGVLDRAGQCIDRTGGVRAVVARYGKDKTFSVPILTHCALAGLVDWGEITPLPFELACLPPRFYKTVRLPVVSYALPALIAIGQVRHHFRPTRNPITRVLRNAAKRRSLAVLERIQPPNGGFLEATPLTSFVTMSLAGMGLVDHPVTRRGTEFIVNSVREDGSWPIDTNLATWVTTLSVNALGDDLPDEAREPILRWLLDQQYKSVHPYTNADPGGWAWTDLPGGVPDADDTAGAVLAILELVRSQESGVRSQESGSIASNRDEQRLRIRETIEGSSALPGPANPQASIGTDTANPPSPVTRPHASSRPPLPDELVCEAREAVRRGVKWLLDLQNRDGGWPTFCRGWGKLLFDRSAADITAHVSRALVDEFLALHPNHKATASILTGEIGAWGGNWITPAAMPDGFGFSVPRSIGRAFRFLRRSQRPNSAWLPLWFGNQQVEGECNATYGTAKVLLAYQRCQLGDRPQYRDGIRHLCRMQSADGGWGGDVGCPSSVEETALAVEVLLSDERESSRVAAERGLLWLIRRVEDGTYREAAPIGFYFARLWYFERLYPLIFTAAALRRARDVWGADSGE